MQNILKAIEAKDRTVNSHKFIALPASDCWKTLNSKLNFNFPKIFFLPSIKKHAKMSCGENESNGKHARSFGGKFQKTTESFFNRENRLISPLFHYFGFKNLLKT